MPDCSPLVIGMFKRPRLGETHYATVTQSGGLALDGGQEFRTRSA